MAKRVYNEVITQDNIQDYGERLSICAVRGLARIMGKYEIHKLYASLIKDIKNKDEREKTNIITVLKLWNIKNRLRKI